MNSRPQPNRNHLTTFVFIFLLLGVLRCFVGDGYAQSIGVNFVGSAGPAGTLASSDVAGVPGNAQAGFVVTIPGHEDLLAYASRAPVLRAPGSARLAWSSRRQRPVGAARPAGHIARL